MSYKIPGLASICLALAGLAIAVYQLFEHSVPLGLLYIIIIPAGFLLVFYSYCRKCPHIVNDTCRHVIPGLIVKMLFKPAKPSNYSLGEILKTLIPLAVIFIMPQYWLLKNLILFIFFWMFTVAAVIIIRAGVCIGCGNINCFFCPDSKCCSK